ncbi:hypothetical protein EC968_005725 [Mortierella alpina]|nr:hypothetical protein EC968_005725 [Mortierella alpina]
MLTYQHYLQTSEISSFAGDGLIEIPDLVVCSRYAGVALITQGMNLTVQAWNISSTARTPANYTGYLAWIYVLPNRDNPYAWNSGMLPPGSPFPRELDDNMYIASQLDSGLSIQTTPVKTWEKRTDIWGLFGRLKTQPQYTVRSSVSDIKRANSSFIMVGLPTFSVEQSELLITTIPNAFASWGGAFSATFGIFHILFGSPRIDPFGIIAVYFFGYNMKRKISKTYGSWRRASPIRKDGHPISGNDNGLASSRASTFADFHQLDQNPSPLSPSCIRSLPTYSFEGNGCSDALEDDMHLDPWARQERHNRVTEAKFKELEGLLREYYLNMELVDTRDSGTGLPWYKRLFSRRASRGQNRHIVPASEVRGRQSMETHRMVDV